MKSKAAILWEVNTPWSIEETELDEPREGEVRVKLAASGLCHSDDHIVKGDLPTGLPIIGGHEGSGIVEAVGPSVRRLKEGDHVVMAFMPACGHCRWCASGLSMLCDYGAIIMEGLPIADQVARVRARGEGLRQVSMLGTYGAAVKRAKVEPGDTVVVVGTGGVGSSAVQGARIAGAEIIVAVDPIEYRREQAKLLGATHAV